MKAKKKITRRPVTQEDVEVIRRMYATSHTSEIAKELGRSTSSIYQMAYKLGLKKDPEWIRLNARLQPGSTIGAKYRFKKGQVPANKGLRRPGWAPGRMSTTQFKPGAVRGMAAERKMPVGSYRLIDGDWWVKIADTPPGEYKNRATKSWMHNWKPVKRVVWEAAGLTVPPGHVLRFKSVPPKSPEKITVDEIECITRAENRLRNSIHQMYPRDLVLTIMTAGALKRKIGTILKKKGVA